MSQAGIAIACLALLLLLGACHRSPSPAAQGAGAPVPPANTSVPARGEAPAGPFRLTVSSGGGFAGQWRGCTLNSAGEATAWKSMASGPRESQWTGKADPDTVAAFARTLEASRDVKLEGAGNMTARLEYASSSGEFQWSVPGAAPGPDSPEPFRTLYPRIEAYCRALAPAP
jgi:hypothetical protein